LVLFFKKELLPFCIDGPRLKRYFALFLAATVAACAGPAARHPPPRPLGQPGARVWQGSADQHVPPFASVPFEPFSRADAIAIALREWRLFGELVDDDPPGTRPPPLPEQKPERMPGLWQRVGEYWWEGLDPSQREAAWTGMHDEYGTLFDASRDGDFAWSAAFISYVMRIAGAGNRFPYAASHADYIDAAVLGQSAVLRAHSIDSYAPKPGDLICTGRGNASGLRFADLPAPSFQSHCDIIVSATATLLTVIGGNVDDAVTEKHVPLSANGTLAGIDGKPVDTRYPWLVVLEVLYDR
jgi:hypothetical protein